MKTRIYATEDEKKQAMAMGEWNKGNIWRVNYYKKNEEETEGDDIVFGYTGMKDLVHRDELDKFLEEQGYNFVEEYEDEED